MRFDADCENTNDETKRCFSPLRTSRALCEVMLKVLSRDNRLRRIYVRQRWQGLVE